MSAIVNKENTVLKPVPVLKMQDFESASEVHDLQDNKEKPEPETFLKNF